MRADVWKNREVAKAFLDERSVLIPDRSRQFEVIARVMRFARTDLRHILDLGTGDGIILATVLDLFSEASGVALDFSSAMLEKARERLAKFGGRALTVEADLGSPAWRDKASGTF